MKVWILRMGRKRRPEVHADRRSAEAAIKALYPGCDVFESRDQRAIFLGTISSEVNDDDAWAEAWEVEVQELAEEVADE